MDIGIAIFLAGVWIAEGITNTAQDVDRQGFFILSILMTFLVVIFETIKWAWF